MNTLSDHAALRASRDFAFDTNRRAILSDQRRQKGVCSPVSRMSCLHVGTSPCSTPCPEQQPVFAQSGAGVQLLGQLCLRPNSRSSTDVDAPRGPVGIPGLTAWTVMLGPQLSPRSERQSSPDDRWLVRLHMYLTYLVYKPDARCLGYVPYIP